MSIQDQKRKKHLTSDGQLEMFPEMMSEKPSSTSKRNSTSGKVLSKADNLVANIDDLCKIIAVCAKNGVSEIRVGEFCLSFGMEDHQPNTYPIRKRPVPTRNKAAQKIQEEAEAQSLAQQVSDDLEELKLSNPLAYERLLATGEVGDVGELS
jgi:hypothetical protein